MDRIKATMLLAEIKGYLTAGNPVWDVDEIAEACDMAIEALRNEINCVKCVHYTERETPTGIKGVCKMDTEHREDIIRRQLAIDTVFSHRYEYENKLLNDYEQGWNDACDYAADEWLESLPSAEAEDRLYIKIYADDEPSVMAEKLYQICGETQNGEVAKWLKEYFPSAEPKTMNKTNANKIYSYLKERIGDTVDDMKEFDAWFERMVWHVKECDRLIKEPKTGECRTCKRNADNGGVYEDGRTKCPIQEHYALLLDGYCHLYEQI